MSHDVDVLNRLIAGLRTAGADYRRAGADGPGLADAFAAAADSHDVTAEMLAAEVRALGGRPLEAAGGDVARAAGARLAAAVAQGEAETAQAMEAIEADLLGALQAAMDDPDTAGPTRDAVVRAFDRVKAGHDAALQRLEALGV